jgi:anti-sigma factor RsiW
MSSTLISPGSRPTLLPWHLRFAFAAMLTGGIAIGWVVRGATLPGDSDAGAAAQAQAAVMADTVFSPGVGHPVEVAASERDIQVGSLSEHLGRMRVVPDRSDADQPGAPADIVLSRRCPAVP